MYEAGLHEENYSKSFNRFLLVIHHANEPNSKNLSPDTLHKVDMEMLTCHLSNNMDSNSKVTKRKLVDTSESDHAKRSRIKKSEDSNNDKKHKWTKLEHNGAYFPPPYTPHNVKMKYKGNEISLEPEAEEFATLYAALLKSEYVQNKKFRENFFKDWVEVLKKSKNNPSIDDFEECDFTPIYEYKRKISKEDKDTLKKKKTDIKKQYGYCKLNELREGVINFRIEPPSIFKGRGMHPKSGSLKFQVQPEDVTINIGEDAKEPSPPEGHNWKEVINKPEVAWIASWKDNVTNKTKYVSLAPNSSLKRQNDMEKYDKARELKKKIDEIRNDYHKKLQDEDISERQIATVVYFIDKLALRVGNEKDLNEKADTVGCCSLRFEHVNLTAPNTVTLNFLGKDSIRYDNTVEVEAPVFQNLETFMQGKKLGDKLFNEINVQTVNKYLSKLMTGLTAKVFRTYNASNIFQEKLKTEKDYEAANREVAIFCNHKNKDKVALKTSMTYYIDPRISVAWSKKHDVSIKEIFSDKLHENFEWAMKVDENWEF